MTELTGTHSQLSAVLRTIFIKDSWQPLCYAIEHALVTSHCPICSRLVFQTGFAEPSENPSLITHHTVTSLDINGNRHIQLVESSLQ